MIILFPFYKDFKSIISINLVFEVAFKNSNPFSTFIWECKYFNLRNNGIAIINKWSSDNF